MDQAEDDHRKGNSGFPQPSNILNTQEDGLSQGSPFPRPQEVSFRKGMFTDWPRDHRREVPCFTLDGIHQGAAGDEGSLHLPLGPSPSFDSSSIGGSS